MHKVEVDQRIVFIISFFRYNRPAMASMESIYGLVVGELLSFKNLNQNPSLRKAMLLAAR